ncbi:MAG: ABC transporter ATP-binding protein [Dehalococcoidia bacterium]|nr:MAG: ABC transporter ATP-binding protein [Dehalococcoidia bacterium]
MAPNTTASTIVDPFADHRWSESSRAPHIEVRDVTVSFGAYTAIRDIELNIARGEFVSLIGHSGCGKSTLLNLMAGLGRPTAGTIRIEGQIVEGPGADRCMVFQHHGLLPWLSVYDNIYVAVDAARRTHSAEEKAARTQRVLQAVRMWDHRTKKPGMLSGGQRQRVAVARAFAVAPSVLLLDEPFGAVDALTKRALHRELVELSSIVGSTETVVMVTHDIDEAIFLSDRIVVMTDGPAAGIREIVDVPIERPRTLADVMHSAVYIELRDHLLALLGDDEPR